MGGPPEGTRVWSDRAGGIWDEGLWGRGGKGWGSVRIGRGWLGREEVGGRVGGDLSCGHWSLLYSTVGRYPGGV